MGINKYIKLLNYKNMNPRALFIKNNVFRISLFEPNKTFTKPFKFIEKRHKLSFLNLKRKKIEFYYSSYFKTLNLVHFCFYERFFNFFSHPYLYQKCDTLQVVNLLKDYKTNKSKF